MMRFKLLVLLIAFSTSLSFGQLIKGKVTDTAGLGIPGVNVKASNGSTSTDIDGSFTIKAESGEKIVFTFIGLETQVVTASNNMKVVMNDSNKQIQEVVVIGYGTRKKIDNTSSIVSFKSKEVNERKVQNAIQAVQGKVAGVNITSSDAPGVQPSVLIRGMNTIEGGRSPLYVVDGMPVGNISNINSNDILTMDVLKDASALAVFGSRGANGVIIITTKQGKSEKMNLEVESFVGLRTPQKIVKMAGSNKYARYNNIALGATTFSQDQPVNTNWFDEITRTGVYTQNNITLSGSTKAVDYMFSGGMYNEDAILNGQSYNRVTIRNNNKYKFNEKISLKQYFNVGIVKNAPKPFGAFTAAYKQSPAMPVRFADGKYGVPFVGTSGFVEQVGSQFNNVGNPVAMLDFHNEQQRNLNLIGGLDFEVKLLKGLKFNSVFGVEYNKFKQFNYVDSKNIWLAADPNRTEAQYLALTPAQPINTLSRNHESSFNYNWTNFVTFNKVLNDIHDFEFTLGTETVYGDGKEQTKVTFRDVPLYSNYWYGNFSTSNLSNAIEDKKDNAYKILSYFGRFQYKLNDKYLVTGTLRRDGSSKYQKDYRWGTFPSLGLGWIVSKEDFLVDNNLIDLLKIRGSWGKLGNQDMPQNNLPFTTSNIGYAFDGTNTNSGTTINGSIDPNLTWEVIEEISAGFDFEMINRKLKGSLDFYKKDTDKLIIPLIPNSTSGLSDATYGSLGAVSNKGFEISLRWDDKINKNLSYWIGGNFSNNKNTLERLDGSYQGKTGGGLGNGQYTKAINSNAIGQPLGSFYLWEQAGFDDNGNMTFFNAAGEEVAQSALTNDDRKFVGSVIPKSMYGVTLGLKYKNIDFSVDGYGTAGSKVYNGKKSQRFAGENVEYDLATDYWSASNTNASNPTPFNAVPIASTYYLESGDFFRINNISIGYTLPKFTNFITNARIYANAVNPFIFQKFSGFSPELNNDGNPLDMQGIEIDAYPTLRSLVFGINLNF